VRLGSIQPALKLNRTFAARENPVADRSPGRTRRAMAAERSWIRTPSFLSAIQHPQRYKQNLTCSRQSSANYPTVRPVDRRKKILQYQVFSSTEKLAGRTINPTNLPYPSHE
jgi:hypothetical protein